VVVQQTSTATWAPFLVTNFDFEIPILQFSFNWNFQLWLAIFSFPFCNSLVGRQSILQNAPPAGQANTAEPPIDVWWEITKLQFCDFVILCCRLWEALLYCSASVIALGNAMGAGHCTPDLVLCPWFPLDLFLLGCCNHSYTQYVVMMLALWNVCWNGALFLCCVDRYSPLRRAATGCKSVGN
jgi:hypothetical protein